LIQKGAIAVDFNGNPLFDNKLSLVEVNQLSLNESTVNYENKILDLLKTGEYTVKEIIKKLQITWSEKKLRDYLKSNKDVETINKKPLRFTMKDSANQQKSLFDE
jgi:hypothetical protein